MILMGFSGFKDFEDFRIFKNLGGLKILGFWDFKVFLRILKNFLNLREFWLVF
jgi:hypothetical protein